MASDDGGCGCFGCIGVILLFIIAIAVVDIWTGLHLLDFVRDLLESVRDELG